MPLKPEAIAFVNETINFLNRIVNDQLNCFTKIGVN